MYVYSYYKILCVCVCVCVCVWVCVQGSDLYDVIIAGVVVTVNEINFILNRWGCNCIN